MSVEREIDDLEENKDRQAVLVVQMEEDVVLFSQSITQAEVLVVQKEGEIGVFGFKYKPVAQVCFPGFRCDRVRRFAQDTVIHGVVEKLVQLVALFGILFAGGRAIVPFDFHANRHLGDLRFGSLHIVDHIESVRVQIENQVESER